MRVLALILIGILGLTGCVADMDEQGPGQDGEEVYRIGIFQPLSGEDADEALAELEGIELAHALNPTVSGKKVELVYADNKSNIFDGKLAARKLVNKKVDIVLGSYGNVMSMTGGQIFSEAEIPAIAISCSNPLVTKSNPYYFRVGTVDAYQAPMMASFILNEINPKRIAILKIAKDDYGIALAQSFSEKLEELNEGIQITSLEIRADMGNVNVQLEKVKEAKAEVVYMPIGIERSLAIMEVAKEIDFKPQFAGTGLWHDDCLIGDGGDLVEGVIFTDYLDVSTSSTEKATEFLSNYKKHYEQKVPSLGAALGYDAYMLAISALQAREDSSEGKSLTELLAAVVAFEGVTGNISFNEDGDPIKPMRISTVFSGECIEKSIAEPDEDLIENGQALTEDGQAVTETGQ